jgi:hypothetical protein
MADPLDSAAAMVGLAGAALYAQLMPNLSDVRKASSDSATGRDVRNGIAVGSAALIGTGALMAFAVRDSRPFMLAIATAVLMGGLFAVTLHLEGE